MVEGENLLVWLGVEHDGAGRGNVEELRGVQVRGEVRVGRADPNEDLNRVIAEERRGYKGNLFNRVHHSFYLSSPNRHTVNGSAGHGTVAVT